MLKYRQYLELSRANRMGSQLTSHSQNYHRSSQISHEESIKELVSKPNYGEIFYSQEGGQKNTRPQTDNVEIRHSANSDKSENSKLAQYLGNLQEQNLFLKQKLNEAHSVALRETNGRQTSHFSNPYAESEQSGPGPTFYQGPQGNGFGLVYQEQQQQENYPQQQQIQQQEPRQRQGQRQRQREFQEENLGQDGYTYPQGNLYSENYFEQGNVYRNSAQPQNRLNYPPQYPSAPQYSAPQPPSAPQFPRSELLALARARLSELKDDDEELRQWTLKVLRK